VPDEVTDEICPNCGKNLVIRSGRFGKFMACPGYPDCKFTKAIIVDTGVPCPKCGGTIIQKKSKTGKIFYGCDHYPECNYMNWDEPLKTKCEICGSNLFRKSGKRRIIYCPNPDCKKQGASKTEEKADE
jgi:DNA topoisomerase-1